MMICMSENKRFWVENERILNTYVLRIFKEDEIIFEINNWNSLNETNKVECEGIANELNKLSDEVEQLKEDKNELFIRERDAKNNCRKLKYENEQLKQAYNDAKEDVEKKEQILEDIMERNLLIQDMQKELKE